MADMKALPVFAFTDERVQIEQLRAFLQSIGSPVDANGPEEFSANLLDLVKFVDIVGEMQNDKEVEMILSSISSLIIMLPYESALDVVLEFCKNVSSEKYRGIGWSSNAGTSVRVLTNLFHVFKNHSGIQYELFTALVKLCGRSKLIGDLDVSARTLSEYFKNWTLEVDEKRSLLRLIHDALINDGRADQAAKIMTILLSTYTKKDASSAIDDGRECVRTAIVDPKSFTFDHILRLPAVQLLEKSDAVMHEILMLFAQGTLSDYREFMKRNPTFVTDVLRVDESVLVKKMRLLTLISMAEKSNMISLRELALEVDIPDEEELEEFIIEAILMNAITGRINGVKGELNVSSLQHRCFGRKEWEYLQNRLVKMITNLKAAQDHIKAINEAADTCA